MRRQLYTLKQRGGGEISGRTTNRAQLSVAVVVPPRQSLPGDITPLPNHHNPLTTHLHLSPTHPRTKPSLETHTRPISSLIILLIILIHQHHSSHSPTPPQPPPTTHMSAPTAQAYPVVQIIPPPVGMGVEYKLHSIYRNWFQK